MAATTGLYLPPYFCFRKYTNFDYGFTCGFDTAPVAHIHAVPESLHQAEVPAVVARLHIPADPTTRHLEVLTIAGFVPKVFARPGVPETLAQPPLQNNFHGVFQQRISNWNSQIWIVMSKSSVFKKNSL